MLIAYDSFTGNVRRFVRKLPDSPLLYDVKESPIIDQLFVLVTYTTGFGEVPESTASFLKRNHGNLMGVAVSGNKNWTTFGKCGDIISALYDVPLLLKFELSGTPTDLIKFMKGAREAYALSRT